MKRIAIVLSLILLLITGFNMNAKAQEQQNQTSIQTQSENAQNDSLTSYYIVQSKLNVRVSANANSKTLGQLDAGEFLEVIEAGPKWIKIQYQGKTGFV